MVAAGKGSLKGGPFWVLRPHSPEHRQHLTIIFFFSIIFYNCPPVPRILWFYVGTLCGLEHTLSLISSSLLPLSAL